MVSPRASSRPRIAHPRCSSNSASDLCRPFETTKPSKSKELFSSRSYSSPAESLAAAAATVAAAEQALKPSSASTSGSGGGPNVTPLASNMAASKAKVSDSVEIWWSADKTFYGGVLHHKIDKPGDWFYIIYDDGEEEEINLDNEIWKFPGSHTGGAMSTLRTQMDRDERDDPSSSTALMIPPTKSQSNVPVTSNGQDSNTDITPRKGKQGRRKRRGQWTRETLVKARAAKKEKAELRAALAAKRASGQVLASSTHPRPSSEPATSKRAKRLSGSQSARENHDEEDGTESVSLDFMKDTANRPASQTTGLRRPSSTNVIQDSEANKIVGLSSPPSDRGEDNEEREHQPSNLEDATSTTIKNTEESTEPVANRSSTQRAADPKPLTPSSKPNSVLTSRIPREEENKESSKDRKVRTSSANAAKPVSAKPSAAEAKNVSKPSNKGNEAESAIEPSNFKALDPQTKTDGSSSGSKSIPLTVHLTQKSRQKASDWSSGRVSIKEKNSSNGEKVSTLTSRTASANPSVLATDDDVAETPASRAGEFRPESATKNGSSVRRKSVETVARLVEKSGTRRKNNPEVATGHGPNIKSNVAKLASLRGPPSKKARSSVQTEARPERRSSEPLNLETSDPVGATVNGNIAEGSLNCTRALTTFDSDTIIEIVKQSFDPCQRILRTLNERFERFEDNLRNRLEKDREVSSVIQTTGQDFLGELRSIHLSLSQLHNGQHLASRTFTDLIRSMQESLQSSIESVYDRIMDRILKLEERRGHERQFSWSRPVGTPERIPSHDVIESQETRVNYQSMGTEIHTPQNMPMGKVSINRTDQEQLLQSRVPANSSAEARRGTSNAALRRTLIRSGVGGGGNRESVDKLSRGGSEGRHRHNHHQGVTVLSFPTEFSARVQHLVALQITVCLLETSHENREEPVDIWSKRTSMSMYALVSIRFNEFTSYEQAFRTLSTSLGNNPEGLEWFNRPSVDAYLHAARHNYKAWDPPPSDEEWKSEVVLLREIGRGYHDAASRFMPAASMTELDAAIAVVQMANDLYRHAGYDEYRNAQGEVFGRGSATMNSHSVPQTPAP